MLLPLLPKLPIKQFAVCNQQQLKLTIRTVIPTSLFEVIHKKYKKMFELAYKEHWHTSRDL